jgi:small GTP-binding protein
MIINYNTKTIQIKIVYFGAAMSGKTTSLKFLMKYFGKEEEFKSIETSTGRTLVCDFACLKFAGGGWTLKILLLSATGQDFYASTRPATIENVDGIIFIVDSQIHLLNDNIRSWNELTLYFGEKFMDLPIIICLNKQDLDNGVDENTINNEFGLDKYQKIQIIKTIANENGEGVIESFNKIIDFIYPGLNFSAVPIAT